MSETKIDEAGLRVLCEAATPGKRRVEPGWNNGGMPTSDFFIPGHNGGASVEMLSVDAELLAALDRETILSLLDLVAALRKERDEARMLHRDAQIQAEDRGASYQRVVKERAEARLALGKISAIRDSIVGMQGFNFSEHAYPLVAVLNEAGYPGAGYEIARANLGTLIEQRDAAIRDRDEAEQRTVERIAAYADRIGKPDLAKCIRAGLWRFAAAEVTR